MCGIVVQINPESGISAALLRSMNERLVHRGPDGAGCWVSADGKIGFAHRRLAIFDLSVAADQPMVDPVCGNKIVFNGEIYNYLEIRSELSALGCTFCTTGDTEVLLIAYRVWGENCLSKLNGMFAFAIWDATRQRLFIARDRFGEKPLFYAKLAGNRWIFASEMKALFAHPDISPSMDRNTLKEYLSGTYTESGEATFFAGVSRFPARSAMLLDLRGTVVRKWCYWDPQVNDGAGKTDPKQFVAEFLRRFQCSVELRRHADVDVGTSLSGGLDSSLIAAILIKKMDAPSVQVKTFSSRFDADSTISEGPQIDAMTSYLGVSGKNVTPDPAQFIQDAERVMWHQEEPYLSASIYAQWNVFQLAATEGVTVLIDGQGADELLGGYQSLFPLRQMDLLDRGQPRICWRLTSLYTKKLKQAATGYVGSFRRFNSGAAWGITRLLLGLVKTYWTGFKSGSLNGIHRKNRLKHALRSMLFSTSIPALLRYADRNSMAFGREVRLPYLDHEFVEWCLSLPDEALIGEGWQKYILRLSAENILPPQIQWRVDKVGFATPFDMWLRMDPLREWAFRHLFHGELQSLPEFDVTSVRAMWERHQSGVADMSWALWRWISLSQWLQTLQSGLWKNGLIAHQ